MCLGILGAQIAQRCLQREGLLKLALIKRVGDSLANSVDGGEHLRSLS
jgi:hypothetical protein